MSRYFMIQSWVGSHENEPDYNGQQCGERNVRSIEVVPLYDQFGNANVSAFSDEAIAARNSANKKPTGVSIRDKILPQRRRLNTLQAQMLELEQSYKAGDMSIDEYSLLRDCLMAKKERAEVLYRKAVSAKPKSYNETDSDLFEESRQDEVIYQVNSNVRPSSHTGTWVDDLPNSNSLKMPIKKALHLTQTLVKWHNRTKAYIQTLKEV